MGVCISQESDDGKLSKPLKHKGRPREVSVSVSSDVANDPEALAALLGGTFIRIDEGAPVVAVSRQQSPKFEAVGSVNSFCEIADGVRAMQARRMIALPSEEL